MLIKLPRDWQTYYAEVKDRCINLIRFKIWNGIDTTRLNSWLKNFHSDHEKYLSACILDSLMYRSNSMTKALIHHLFNAVLPNYTRLNPTPIGQINDWLFRLSKKQEGGLDPGVRLVAVLSEFDSPTKSSPYILRLLSKEFMVGTDWIIHPSKVKYHYDSGIKTFLFIDDFLGTGHQFCDTVIEYAIFKKHDLYALYCPLVAHEKGSSYIHQTLDGRIPVVSSEFLTSDMNFFDTYFNDQAEQAREFYVDMLLKRGIKLPSGENKFGYGDLQIAYSFEDSCPDNSLNVLWFDQDGWSPLFSR